MGEPHSNQNDGNIEQQDRKAINFDATETKNAAAQDQIIYEPMVADN